MTGTQTRRGVWEGEARTSRRVSESVLPGCAREDEGSAEQGGTPPAPSGESASTGSLDHLSGGGPLSIMLARTADRTPAPRRCDCGDYLRHLAEQESTGSRDFGRGYMHAVRLLDEPTAEGPSLAEWRSRCALALSVVRHRLTGPDGALLDRILTGTPLEDLGR